MYKSKTNKNEWRPFARWLDTGVAEREKKLYTMIFHKLQKYDSLGRRITRNVVFIGRHWNGTTVCVRARWRGICAVDGSHNSSISFYHSNGDKAIYEALNFRSSKHAMNIEGGKAPANKSTLKKSRRTTDFCSLQTNTFILISRHFPLNALAMGTQKWRNEIVLDVRTCVGDLVLFSTPNFRIIVWRSTGREMLLCSRQNSRSRIPSYVLNNIEQIMRA